MLAFVVAQKTAYKNIRHFNQILYLLSFSFFLLRFLSLLLVVWDILESFPGWLSPCLIELSCGMNQKVNLRELVFEIEKDKLERIQRRAMAIIFPNINYSEALNKASLPKVPRERQHSLCKNMFKQITINVNCKIHELLPPRNESIVNTKNNRTFRIPVAKTNRFEK